MNDGAMPFFDGQNTDGKAMNGVHGANNVQKCKEKKQKIKEIIKKK